MELYESERDQVDALKQWWKENGRTALVGVALGLAAVVGWTSWQAYQTNRAGQASQIYQQLLQAAAVKNHRQVEEQSQLLTDDYAGSGYAALAALLAASSDFEQDNVEGAKQQLEWVMSNTDQVELKQVARLRLARLRLNEEDHDAALQLLDGTTDAGSFAASYDEVRGDVLVAKGELESARSAYEKALANLPTGGPMRNRIQMKLDDLGHISVTTESES